MIDYNMMIMKLIPRIVLALLVASPLHVMGQERYGETEEQQILCKEAISVYVSYKKQKNYDEAFIQWKKACDVCPATAREGIYSDGVRFLKNELKKNRRRSENQVHSGQHISSLRSANGVVPCNKEKTQQPLYSARLQGHRLLSFLQKRGLG